MFRRRLARCATALAVIFLASLAGGCGGGRFGTDLPSPTRPQALRAAEGSLIRLPKDRPFSIAVPQATRRAGLDGTADSDASCSPTGTARATAAVTRSGEASALFQLGHSFANDTDRQIDMQVTVRYQCSFEAAADPELGYPDASIGLRLYAREKQGRLLRDLVLIQYGSESGPTRRQAADEVNFTLTLAPGTAVDIFAAGQARVEIRGGADPSATRSARGTLELAGFEMEARILPAPAASSEDSAAQTRSSEDARP